MADATEKTARPPARPPARSTGHLYISLSGVPEKYFSLMSSRSASEKLPQHTHPQTVNTRFSVLTKRVDHWHKNVICYDLIVVNPKKR